MLLNLCSQEWCCGKIYVIADDDFEDWRCPFSGSPVSHILNAADWYFFNNYIVLLSSPGLWRSERQHQLALQVCGNPQVSFEQIVPSSQYLPDGEEKCALLRDILGNPLQPPPATSVWQSATVTKIASSIYEQESFDDMPILADALEDAGCTDAFVLGHCRQREGHVLGCWVLDQILGKP